VRSAAPRPLFRTELRLHLDDGGSPPTGRRIVDGPFRRCAVVLCDAAVVSAIAIGARAAFGLFWMPAAVAMVAYYWGGLALFGHTLGVRVIGAILRRRCRKESTGMPRDAATLESADAPRRRPSLVTTTTAG
jgi:hypothetical protein